jgi:hypothetical protein
MSHSKPWHQPTSLYFLTEETADLPGWPGYRTRPGRAGLDYLDSEYEWAHMQGVLYRKFFTGKFRTRDPLHLLLMLLFVAITCHPFIYFFGMALSGNWLLLFYNLILSAVFIYPLLGIAVLINLVLSLFPREKEEPEIETGEFDPPGESPESDPRAID